jgi:hypothetical protein
MPFLLPGNVILCLVLAGELCNLPLVLLHRGAADRAHLPGPPVWLLLLHVGPWLTCLAIHA